MTISVLIFLILFVPALSSAQTWLVVPKLGNGTAANMYRANVKVLPRSVVAYSGQPTTDGKSYMILVNEDFSKDKPSPEWRIPGPAEVALEMKKHGLNSKAIKPPPKGPPPKQSLLKRLWRRIGPWIGPAIAWALSGSDDFNRSDANPISGSWDTDYGSTVQIISDTVRPTDLTCCGNENRAGFTAFTATPDQSARIDVSILSSGVGAAVGVMLRGNNNSSGPGLSYYACVAKDGITQIYEYPSYATVSEEFSTVWSPGDQLTCIISGTDIELQYNGVAVTSGNDATITTGQPGIILASDGTVNDAALDNFFATDLAAAPGAVITRRRAVQW